MVCKYETTVTKCLAYIGFIWTWLFETFALSFKETMYVVFFKKLSLYEPTSE